MKSDEWLTPPEILQPLGQFDLDPCSPICLVAYGENKVKPPVDSGLGMTTILGDAR